MIQEGKKSSRLKQRMKAILPMILLDIILPTVDVFSDIILIYNLFTAGWRCAESGKYKEDFYDCNNSPNFCDYREETKKNVCLLKIVECNSTSKDKNLCYSFQGCYDPNHEDYLNCSLLGAEMFCQNSYKDVCVYGYPISASNLFLFVLLSYIFSWITWVRLDANKTKNCSFIFPLLNFYPQFGKKSLFYYTSQFIFFFRSNSSHKNNME